MFIFNKIHSSSKWSRSNESLKRAVARYIQHAILITLTETELPRRKNALREICRVYGYGFITGEFGNKNDGSILFSLEEFEEVHSENHKLSNKVFKIGRHTTPPSYATLGVLRHRKSGLILVVGVYHTPSSVEGDLYHHRKTSRVITWYANVRSLRKRANALKKHYHATAAIISCDWNINWHKKWVRALIKTMFPAWKSTWQRHVPKGGTHGRRLIDWSLVKGNVKVLSSDLFVDDASSDHRPYIERISVG